MTIQIPMDAETIEGAFVLLVFLLSVLFSAYSFMISELTASKLLDEQKRIDDIDARLKSVERKS